MHFIYYLSKLRSSQQKFTLFVKRRQCHPASLDENKVKGKIVICDGKSDEYSTSEKVNIVTQAGGLGLVHITDQGGAVAANPGDFPATVISPEDGTTLLQYLNSSR